MKNTQCNCGDTKKDESVKSCTCTNCTCKDKKQKTNK